MQPEAPVFAFASGAEPELRRAVMESLDAVLDPELDESVVAMGFIESVAIKGSAVEIVFRLPTYWCSANFAFLMATDMRAAVEQLSFVNTVQIRLVDHFAARKINQGVAAGLGFAAVFYGEAETDLDEIRRLFRDRAFLGRQEKLLRLAAGRWGAETVLATTVAELEALGRHDDPDLRAAALRYLVMRRHEQPSGPDAPAFVTLEGTPVTLGDYPAHLRMVRSLRGAAEANAEMCRIYLDARKTHPAPGCGPEHRDDDE